METQSPQQVKSLVTKKDVANYLAVSISTINRLILSKELKPIKIGGSIRFSWETVKAFAEKGGQNVV